jgi:hypothetical protein
MMDHGDSHNDVFRGQKKGGADMHVRSAIYKEDKKWNG